MGAVAAPRAVAVALAILVFAAYAAPIVLSGQATFAGYIRLDDTATWMALTDRVMEHGRSLAGLAPSTYEATLSFNLGDGYPIGVFLPLGVARALVTRTSAWLIQPYMAFGGGAGGTGALAARGADRPPASAARWRCRSSPRIGASVRLLPLGRHQGGRGGRAPRSSAGLAGFAIRERCAPRALIPLAIAGAALIGVLSGGGGIWLAGGRGSGAGVRACASSGRAPRCRSPPPSRSWSRVLCVPVLVPGGFLPPTSASLSSATALGNLLHPLNGLQLFGIWPAGDFRWIPRSRRPRTR